MQLLFTKNSIFFDFYLPNRKMNLKDFENDMKPEEPMENHAEELQERGKQVYSPEALTAQLELVSRINNLENKGYLSSETRENFFSLVKNAAEAGEKENRILEIMENINENINTNLERELNESIEELTNRIKTLQTVDTRITRKIKKIIEEAKANLDDYLIGILEQRHDEEVNKKQRFSPYYAENLLGLIEEAKNQGQRPEFILGIIKDIHTTLDNRELPKETITAVDHTEFFLDLEIERALEITTKRIKYFFNKKFISEEYKNHLLESLHLANIRKPQKDVFLSIIEGIQNTIRQRIESLRYKVKQKIKEIKDTQEIPPEMLEKWTHQSNNDRYLIEILEEIDEYLNPKVAAEPVHAVTISKVLTEAYGKEEYIVPAAELQIGEEENKTPYVEIAEVDIPKRKEDLTASPTIEIILDRQGTKTEPIPRTELDPDFDEEKAKQLEEIILQANKNIEQILEQKCSIQEIFVLLSDHFILTKNNKNLSEHYRTKMEIELSNEGLSQHLIQLIVELLETEDNAEVIRIFDLILPKGQGILVEALKCHEKRKQEEAKKRTVILPAQELTSPRQISTSYQPTHIVSSIQEQAGEKPLLSPSEPRRSQVRSMPVVKQQSALRNNKNEIYNPNSLFRDARLPDVIAREEEKNKKKWFQFWR